MKHYYSNIQGWFGYRNLFTKAVRYFPKESHFVEMGCWRGKSSIYLAVEIERSNKKIRLDCVDTWEGSIEHKENLEFESLLKNDGLYREFIENIKPVSHVINVVRSSSVIAAEKYASNSLDFIFIDGSHDYKSVTEDLHAWYPKIKPDGVIAGHDYNYPSVKKAVNTFFYNKLNNKSIIDCGEKCWLYSGENFIKYKI